MRLAVTAADGHCRWLQETASVAIVRTQFNPPAGARMCRMHRLCRRVARKTRLVACCFASSSNVYTRQAARPPQSDVCMQSRRTSRVNNDTIYLDSAMHVLAAMASMNAATSRPRFRLPRISRSRKTPHSAPTREGPTEMRGKEMLCPMLALASAWRATRRRRRERQRREGRRA